MAWQEGDERAEALAAKIEAGFGTQGRTLEDHAVKAGRALPKPVRDDLDLILQARGFKGNPRLERQVDAGAVDRAYRHVEGWLKTVDGAARRRAGRLNLLSDVAFKLFVVLCLFLAVVIWRGLV